MPNDIYATLTETLACFVRGRAKDLSAPLHVTAKQCSRPVPIYDLCLLQRISSTLGTVLCIADRSMARSALTQTNIA